MKVNRLLAMLASMGMTGAVAGALLVELPQAPSDNSQSAQPCLIGTKTCESLSKMPAGPCLTDTQPCPKEGKLVAASPRSLVSLTGHRRRSGAQPHH